MLKFHSLKIKAKSAVAEDAVSITFDLPTHLREHYRFKAGQHVAVRLPGAAEDTRRSYSIVSAMDSDDLSIGVRVLPGGQVSSFIGEVAEVGGTLEVLTPNGSFHTRIEPERAKRYLAFAAGSGITPIVSIAKTILEREPRSRMVLFYGNRTAASTMFLDEIMGLKNRYISRFAPHFLLSREPQEIGLFNGRLDGARVRELAGAMFDVAAIDEYFICGPGSMVEDVRGALRELGATGKIHTELFTTAGSPVERCAVVTPLSTSRDVTEVVVVMDGRQRNFSMPRNEFVLDAAGGAGLELPYSCRAGVCSTCRAKLVKGEITMEQNMALEEWEVKAGYFLCCQARPTTERIEITYDE